MRIYDQKYWWSDEWDPMQYGRAYDFSKPFFVQFCELLGQTPLITLSDSKSTNTSYCNMVVECKNCYMLSAVWGSEDSCYSNRISYCKDTVDSYICHRMEISYENVYCKDSYRLFFSWNCESCNNSYFLYDCRGCSDCVCCTSLRNKQYHIFNKPYSKEEYQKELEKLDLGDINTLRILKKKLDDLYAKSIHKYAQILKSVNVVGDNVEEAKNCFWCFDVAGNAENSKYCNWATYNMRDCYDSGPGAGGNCELVYEGVSAGVSNARCSFGVTVWYSHDVHYSYTCDSSSYLFGCVSLRNKQYCILNKQYSKEEYESLVPRIIRHMNTMPYVDSKGRVYKYGEFFPPDLSPFAYNETIAQEYYPLTKEEALNEGYRWKDPEARNYEITLRPTNLPASIEEASDKIVDEMIGCEHEGKCKCRCTSAFRIIPQELVFYRKFNLPLPHLCPNCRHYERLKQRNPIQLWHRKCQCNGESSEKGVYRNTVSHIHNADHCPNEFETPYAPERPEVIYCEECYQREVA